MLKEKTHETIGSVHVLVVAKGIQNDILVEDVVAEAEIALTDAPLAHSRVDPGELGDVILPRAVVRVFSKDGA